jgi:thiaminase
VAQDAHYLRAYADVLTAVAELAPTADERTFWTDSARGTVTAELQLHGTWLPSSDTAAPSATTTRYLDHLRAAVTRGDYAILAAAVLPCFWLYADLGTRLRAVARPAHPYTGWLETYGDPVFDAAARRAVAIVTTHAADAGADTRAAMWTAFRTSSEHELAFFDAPLDSTVTAEDR